MNRQGRDVMAMAVQVIRCDVVPISFADRDAGSDDDNYDKRKIDGVLARYIGSCNFGFIELSLVSPWSEL
jgi:hypothetical protein